MKDILRKCESLEYHQLKPRAMDGEWYLETTLFANHHNPEVEELFEFLAYAASRAPGSYGVFYMHDDEDRTGRITIHTCGGRRLGMRKTEAGENESQSYDKNLLYKLRFVFCIAVGMFIAEPAVEYRCN